MGMALVVFGEVSSLGFSLFGHEGPVAGRLDSVSSRA